MSGKEQSTSLTGMIQEQVVKTRDVDSNHLFYIEIILKRQHLQGPSQIKIVTKPTLSIRFFHHFQISPLKNFPMFL